VDKIVKPLNKKKMLKNIFTKEMISNAVVTLAVVMVALAVHDRFVAPRLKGNGGTATPPIDPADTTTED